MEFETIDGSLYKCGTKHRKLKDHTCRLDTFLQGKAEDSRDGVPQHPRE